MRRRGFLAAGGTLAATVTGSVSEIRHRIERRLFGALDATEDVELRIAETNAPVEGGDLLEVRLEVENVGDTAVRPEIESYVDGDRRATVRTTVDPGETETLDHFAFRTYPSEADDAVTVRFESEYDAVEETVDVHGIDGLDPGQTAPDPELTVEPGTTVHFEVESDLLGEHGGRTRWFVDGEFAAQPMGPWDAAYYGRRGADHWQTTFESPGTREVTAAVVGEDDARRATWTVEVTDDGVGGPVIEGTDPTEEAIEHVRDDTTDLALDVAYPDGELDRVVWWLGHADVIVGESDVGGTEDVATLELDRACYGCPIVTWVIGTDGATTSETPWVIDEIVDDPEPELELTILETNDPVDTGETLEVIAELENRGAAAVTRDVDLIVGHDPAQVDSETVTVDGEATETIELEFTTAVVRRTQAFPARVETEDASDEVTVEVIGEEDVGVDVEILETNSPVETGDPLDATVEVANDHDAELRREVQLVVGHDPDVVDAELVTLQPDEGRVLTMGYETAIVDRPQRFPVRVESAVDADEESVFVYVDDPPLQVSIVETNDPVAAGDFLEVTAEVENPGESPVTDRIEFIVGHDPDLVDVADVELAGGEGETIDLGFETATVPRTQEFPVNVESDGDRATRTVRVIGTEDDELAIGFPDCTRAEAVGTLEAGDDLTTEILFVDTAGVGNAHYTVTAGEELDAPFTGTIRVEIGEETRLVDGPGDEVVLEIADAGFGATIGSVIYNWFGDDEIREGNPHDCVDERRPEQPSIEVADVTPGEESHEVTFASENPNDLPLHGGAFVEGTTDDEPPELEPGSHSFTVDWAPESADERLVWEVDLELYLYDETLRAETDPAGEYDEPEPDPELALVDYHILGSDQDEEYVTIRNVGDETIDMSGWTMEDDHLIPAHRLAPFPFPEGFSLEPDAAVTIVTGSADGEFPGETISWNVHRHVWNEDGDVVRVFDDDGDLQLEEAIEAERTAELAVDDQEGDGETLLVDHAWANVAFVLEALYDGETAESEAFDADATIEGDELELDPPIEDDATVDVRVRDAETDDELAAEEITYTLDLAEADVEITALDAPDAIDAGETIEVTATLENVGEETATQAIALDVGTQEAVDAVEIELEGGEADTVTLSSETSPEDVGEVTVTVRSEDDEATATVTVEESPDPASFAVTSVDAPGQVEAGDSITVTATIENEGDEAGDAEVALDVDGQQGVDTDVIPSLAGGGSQSVSLTYTTTEADVGDLTATVRIDDESASVTVTVVEPEPEEPDPDPPDEPDPDPPGEPDPDPPEEPDPDPPGEPDPDPPGDPDPGPPDDPPPDDPPPEEDPAAEPENEE